MKTKLYLIFSSVLILLLISGCQFFLSSNSDIVQFSFSIAGETYEGVIQEDKVIMVTVPFRTDIRALVPDFVASHKATVTPESGTELDFTSPLPFTVTAEDGSEAVFLVVVVIAPNTEREILEFGYEGIEHTVEIGQSQITVIVPFRTDVTKLSPIIEVSENAIIEPVIGIAQDFSQPVNYSVIAEDGSSASYEVTVIIAPNTENDILALSFDNHKSIVSVKENEVTVTVPFGTDVKNLVPSISVSENAVIQPRSGQGQDFSQPVTYLVTAEDESVKQYTVKVIVAPNPKSSAKDFLNFELQLATGRKFKGNINGTDITVALPSGSETFRAKAIYTLSPKAKINIPNHLSYSTPVKFTITAEDGSTKTYTVTTVGTSATYPLYGEAAMKEFEWLNYKKVSNKAAIYNVRNIEIGLLQRDERFWQLQIRSWGLTQRELILEALTVLLGRNKAWSSMRYIDLALSMPNSVFSATYVTTFVQDGKLIVHVKQPSR